MLPVLGALPDSIIILVAGFGGSRHDAQQQVAIGVGTLAGSTVMLLTIVYAGSILLGRCDISPITGLQVDKTLSARRWWDLRGTGVSTDTHTPRMAWAMVATTGCYAVVQLPASFGLTRDPGAALAGAILCFLALIGYCSYHVSHERLWGGSLSFRLHAAHDVCDVL